MKYLLTLCLVFKIITIGLCQDNPNYDHAHNNQLSGFKLSPTQVIRLQQRQNDKQAEKRRQVDKSFNEFLFEIQGSVQEFIINIPVAQQIVMNMFSYIIEEGIYQKPKDVQNQPPVKVYIYENNNRIVYQGSFHFQHYIVFDGYDDSTYMIRFINSGKPKMINLNIQKITEQSHIEDVVEKQDVQDRENKIRKINQQVKYLTNAFKRYALIHTQAIKSLLFGISLYLYWEIVEVFIAVCVCLFQVGFIKRMCKQDSIV